MCVIAVAETRRISRDELMLQWEANPHGGGLAYIKDGQVHYEKGFESPDELWKAVKKLPLPYVVHTRIATAGGIRRDLTHPFPITERVKLALRGACKAVLFHNGHWNGYEMAQATMDQSIGALNGAVSDSRVMARVLAVQGIDARELVPTSQRLCLLSAADGVTMQGHGWVNHSGMWTSNCSWQYKAPVYSNRTSYSGGRSVTVWNSRTPSTAVSDPFPGSLHAGTKGTKKGGATATSKFLAQGKYDRDKLNRAHERGFIGDARSRAKAFAQDLDRDVVTPSMTRTQLQQTALEVLSGRVQSEPEPSRFSWHEDDNDRLVLLGESVGDMEAASYCCTEEADCDCESCRELEATVRRNLGMPEPVE